MKFEDLQVNIDIVRSLNELGINEPTLIQQKAIPLIREGKDVIGMSKTGSGKTAAFGVPILEKIKPGQGLQVLVMAPTRELAVQISSELQKFGKYLKFKIATVFGGVSLEPQTRQIAVADIVVGTPGRLLDHLNRRNLNLSKINCFVLDEADKMVEMGFIEDINQILNYTPRDKQVLLFGATISTEIDRLKEQHMDNPAVAEAESQVKEDFLEQYYYDIQAHEKFSLLVHLLKKEETDRVIIFCSARSTVELITKNLRNNGIKNEMIHGKLSQNRRLQVIDSFNKDKIKILVASAVAARGLHIDGVSHVFNYDLSQDPQEYIHRVGRTARAGQYGKAITLLGPRDHDTFRYILDRYRIDVEELPREDFAKVRFDARREQKQGFGSRGNWRGRSNSRGGSGDRSRGSGRSYSGPRRSYS